jgi:leucyl-tRNA synthetase
MLPVDKYIGGPEHAAMHLLYARFITKALRDLGFLNFDEPFKSLVHQGIILGPDGNRMSKSKGNIVSPDDYIKDNGSDTFRLYLMFGFAYSEGGPWNDDGLKAISRFVSRIERLIEKYNELKTGTGKDIMKAEEKKLNFARHTAIKGVTEDADKFQFNTSIARLMELVNAMYKYDNEVLDENKNINFIKVVLEDFLRTIAPFAPHFSEEMWEKMGNEYSVFNQAWPEWDEKALVMDTIEMAIQINGKLKGKIEVPSESSEKETEELVVKDEATKTLLEGKEIKKIIVIRGRIINIVVK